MSEVSGAQDRWRTPYREFYEFPKLGFAWEFLRRNERFRRDLASGAERWSKVAEQGQFTVYRGSASKIPHDCLFADLAEADASVATVLWNPELCPAVLRAIALPSRGDASSFILEKGWLPTTLLQSDNGIQHVLIRDRVRCLQLEVRGESLLQPVSLLVDTAAAVCRQNRALQALKAYRTSAVLPETYFSAEPRAHRNALVLQALDGWLAGARHRELAVALYGKDRVARDWADPEERLRDQVRYAITRGRALMDHGYRAFLH